MSISLTNTLLENPGLTISRIYNQIVFKDDEAFEPVIIKLSVDDGRVDIDFFHKGEWVYATSELFADYDTPEEAVEFGLSRFLCNQSMADYVRDIYSPPVFLTGQE